MITDIQIGHRTINSINFWLPTHSPALNITALNISIIRNLSDHEIRLAGLFSTSLREILRLKEIEWLKEIKLIEQFNVNCNVYFLEPTTVSVNLNYGRFGFNYY